MGKLRKWLNLKDPIVRIKVLLVLGAALIVTLFMTVGAITLTSTPTFCSACHEMDADIEAWRKSSHSEVTCYGCHSEGNLAVFLIHKVESLKEVYFHLADNYEKPINAHSHYAEKMSNEPCERCHSFNRKVTSSPGVIIDHKKHEEKGITCVTCHNRVGHPNIKDYVVEKGAAEEDKVHQASLKPGVEQKISAWSKPYEDHMEMRFCMVCHTGEKEKGSRECETCHPPEFELKPEDHGDANWFPPQEQLLSVKAIHGEQAKEDMANCVSCHEQKFCNDCHKAEIPHPETWKEEHREILGKEIDIVKAAPEQCAMCHPQPNFCDACHHQYDPAKGPWYSTQPGLSLHVPAVREKGATECFKCHKPTYCAHCHVRGTKE